MRINILIWIFKSFPGRQGQNYMNLLRWKYLFTVNPRFSEHRLNRQNCQLVCIWQNGNKLPVNLAHPIIIILKRIGTISSIKRETGEAIKYNYPIN